MKRFITLILIALLALPTLSAAIDKKSLKEIKREAKRLEAEGWKPSVSALNIEEQCIRAAEYAEAKDKSGAPIYNSKCHTGWHERECSLNNGIQHVQEQSRQSINKRGSRCKGDFGPVYYTCKAAT